MGVGSSRHLGLLIFRQFPDVIKIPKSFFFSSENVSMERNDIISRYEKRWTDCIASVAYCTALPSIPELDKGKDG
jgi:hypothetical protein